MNQKYHKYFLILPVIFQMSEKKKSDKIFYPEAYTV